MPIDRDEIDLDPAFPQLLAGMQHRMMFDCAGDDMIPRLNRTKDRQVIALRPAAGKDNFRRPATEEPRHASPRLLYCPTSVLAFLVDRRSIAEPFQQKRTHSLQHLRQQRRGSIRIQIDSPHHSILRGIYPLRGIHRRGFVL